MLQVRLKIIRHFPQASENILGKLMATVWLLDSSWACLLQNYVNPQGTGDKTAASVIRIGAFVAAEQITREVGAGRGLLIETKIFTIFTSRGMMFPPIDLSGCMI